MCPSWIPGMSVRPRSSTTSVPAPTKAPAPLSEPTYVMRPPATATASATRLPDIVRTFPPRKTNSAGPAC